jgi:hypothetical protein
MTVFDPSQSVVLILKPDGTPEGAGFLISRRYVMTCAHVFDVAVDGRGSISVQFPLLDGAVTVPCRLKRRYPPSKTPLVGVIDDVAVMEIEAGGRLPSKARPSRWSLLPDAEMAGRAVEMYGFPEDMRRDHWVGGTVSRRVSGGRIQIDHKAGGRTVVRGFSGTMVWDRAGESLLGMVADVYKDDKGEVTASYMIPAGVIRRVWDAVTGVGVPPLLCYRVDRRDQVAGLRRRVDAHDGGPIVCALHGDEGQCHEALLKCIEHHYWRKDIQKAPPTAAGPKRIPLRWPRGRDRRFDEFQAELLGQLCNAVNEPDSSDPALVGTVFNRKTADRPVLVHTWISSEDWDERGEAPLLSHFAGFWDQWPARNRKSPLVACLCVIYMSEPVGDRPRRSFFQRLFDRRPDMARINRQIRRTLSARALALDELMGIRRTDAWAWAEEPEIRDICRANGIDARETVGKIFEAAAGRLVDNRLPLDDLAKQLDRAFPIRTD